MEYIEMLDEMLLYFDPDFDYGDTKPYRTKLDEGVEIFEEDLKIMLHIYAMVAKPEDPPTAEEVKSLYYQYDEDIYQKFYTFYRWYDGYLYTVYHFAMNISASQYSDQFGEPLIDKRWGQYTFEDFLKLEEYVKENSDFSETSNDYKWLLKWLDVERPAETPQA